MSRFTSEILRFDLQFNMENIQASVQAVVSHFLSLSLPAATSCTIKLPCYSQDEIPTGIGEDYEVKKNKKRPSSPH